MQEYTHTFMIKGKNPEKVFDEAVRYFTKQDFSLKSQSRPSVLLFERGHILSLSFNVKRAYATLKVLIECTNDTIIIKCDYYFPYSLLLPSDKNKLTMEIEGFRKCLLEYIDEFK